MEGGKGEVAMTDGSVRAAVKKGLVRRYGGDRTTLIVEELGLKHGAARVDLAVINGRLLGIEIKSNSDSLRRLSHQMRVYNSVLDRMSLVCGDRHLNAALGVVPDWWGITRAEMGHDGNVRLRRIRESQDNPAPDPVAIAKLLWRGEALDILNSEGKCHGLRSKPRGALYEKLAEVLELDVLRARVRQKLRARSGWRSDAPQKRGDG